MFGNFIIIIFTHTHKQTRDLDAFFNPRLSMWGQIWPQRHLKLRHSKIYRHKSIFSWMIEDLCLLNMIGNFHRFPTKNSGEIIDFRDEV